jgi:hypothetical protein
VFVGVTHMWVPVTLAVQLGGELVILGGAHRGERGKVGRRLQPLHAWCGVRMLCW